MKYVVLFAAVCVLFCVIFSAGCIGTTSTDIMFGDQKVGELTLTPQDNLFSGEGSITDKVNMQVDIFGLTFNRNGVSMSEAADISSLLQNGDLSALSGFTSLSGNEFSLSGSDFAALSALMGESAGLADSSGSLDAAGKNLEILLSGLAEVFSG
ncbi:MAG TPA: hypothetical protein O0X39_07215 [Methanocorpusculum sp.]|nr:hypothetical protein [Methanocorpusculum sp.]